MNNIYGICYMYDFYKIVYIKVSSSWTNLIIRIKKISCLFSTQLAQYGSWNVVLSSILAFLFQIGKIVLPIIGCVYNLTCCCLSSRDLSGGRKESFKINDERMWWEWWGRVTCGSITDGRKERFQINGERLGFYNFSVYILISHSRPKSGCLLFYFSLSLKFLANLRSLLLKQNHASVSRRLFLTSHLYVTELGAKESWMRYSLKHCNE